MTIQRRSVLAATAALATGGILMNQQVESAAAAAAGLQALRPSPRMPVLFVGHGSPMNAITDNAYRRSWETLGADFGRKLPKPQLVLCISAHWITQGWYLTGQARPKTIHDFGGFPQALFDQQFPAPGAPAVAAQIAAGIAQPKVGVDADEWGYDHGTWSVLKPMFPLADVPVLQLSMDYSRPPAEHFALGRQLRALRDQGVLVVGSGNIVHNLRATRRDAKAMQAYDWAFEFDKYAAGLIGKGALSDLSAFQKLGQVAQLAHPTHDHYLPLLHAAGAVHEGEAPKFFNENFQAASISMRSVVWG
jgi:4,5-DOPA dioxygenase extradiol